MVVGVLAGAACTSAPSEGVAYLHVSKVAAACPVTRPLSTWPAGGCPANQLDCGATGCPTDDPMCAVDRLVLPFEHAHGTAAFEGGSKHSGGNVIAAAFHLADGALGRMQIDVGPDQGYGTAMIPFPQQLWTPIVYPEQAIGYVEWRDGVRTFAATGIRSGFFKYVQSGLVRTPGTMFAQVAFDGLAADGSTQCRVIALHASGTAPRTEAYDPSWLTPEPGILLDNGAAPSDLASDAAPENHLVEPAGAPADPGGAMPEINLSRYLMPPGPDNSGAANAAGVCD